MTGPDHIRTGGVLLLLLLGLACDGAKVTRSAQVPAPALDRFEASIRDQIEEARRNLGAELAKTGEDPARLAAHWGDLGNTFHAYELVSAARACYTEARILAPRDPKWPYFLGQLERELGDPSAAEQAFEEAVRLDADCVPAWVALGETRLENGNLAESRSALAAALERVPSCSPALVGLAKLALEEGSAAEAYEQLDRALALQPEANAIHHHLARAARQMGKQPEAERHLALAGPRQPSLADPWMARIAQRRLGTHNWMTQAQKAARNHRLGEAEDLYRRVLAKEPENVRALGNLGATLARQGRLEEAQRELERAVALDPTDSVARFDLGTVLLRRNDPRAASELAAAVELDPRHPGARFNLAAALSRLGRDEEALLQYRALVDLAPRSPSAYLGVARMERQLRRPQAAVAILEAGIARSGGAPILLSTLARLLATAPEGSIRDGTRALDLANRAITADPSWENLRARASALAELGRFPEAEAVYLQALEMAQARGERPETIDELARELDQAARRQAIRESVRGPRAVSDRLEATPGQPG